MASTFLRYFTSDPGQSVLTEVEAVIIVDTEPPAPINGIGTGVVLFVGEFENGNFNEPYQVEGAGDLLDTFGAFGHTYDGVVAQNPCARARYADSAIYPEYWNGNGRVHLTGKTFAGLICVRVDTSIGAVEFTRLASLNGVAKWRYSVSHGQFITFDDGSGNAYVTFDGHAATLIGSGAAFNTLTAGETVVLGLDAYPDFTVTFLSTDTTCALVSTRINQYAGFAFSAPFLVSGAAATVSASVGVAATVNGTTNDFANITNGMTATITVDGGIATTVSFVVPGDTTGSAVVSRINTALGATVASLSLGGDLVLTGALAGPRGKIVASGTALTKLGLTAGTTNGTNGFASITTESFILNVDGAGDVTVTFATDTTGSAVCSRINTAVGFTCATLSTAGNLILTGVTLGGSIVINSGGTALTKLGLTAGTTVGSLIYQLQFTGRRRGTGGEIRVVSGSTGTVAKLGLSVATTDGTGNVADLNSVSIAELNTLIYAANPDVHVEALADGTPRMVADLGTELTIDAASDAIDFGFATGVTSYADSGIAGTIPTGTRVKNAGGTVHLVTMQDIGVLADSAGPYSVKVRHATDDGTGLSALAGTMNALESPIALGSFSVVNPLPISVAKTEQQIDNAYVDALAATLDLSSIASISNIVVSARQSNVIRRALKQNANDATSGGCYGRITHIRPPLGSSKTTAKSTTAEPGVGAYRDQRVVYNYPGFQVRIPAMAQVGTSGGAGFTSEGVINVGSDVFMASLESQLPPEENPGQQTSFLSNVLGIESGLPGAAFTMQDYISFKASGICAPRIDNGDVFFQSGITSVDPIAHGGLVRISRRRMADWLQGTAARVCQKYGKLLNKAARRTALLGELRAWSHGLTGPTNEAERRIAGYSVTDKNMNTASQLAAGLYKIKLNYRLLSSMDDIVLMSTVGEDVQVDELAPGEVQ